MGKRYRLFARDACASALRAAGVTAPRRAGSGCLTIATFHRVLLEPQRREYLLPGLAVTPEELRWLLDFFGGHYTCETLDRAFGRWRAGERPERPFLAVTFDDGQRDNLVHGAPLLAQAGIRATFFATVAHVESGGPIWHDRLLYALRSAKNISPEGAPLREEPSDVLGRAKRLPMQRMRELVDDLERRAGGPTRPAWDAMMTWEDLTELANAGHEIGSHTLTHPILPNCTDAEIEREVTESKRLLEKHLDRPITSFAYPNGDCDLRSVEAVRRAGYRQAVTVRWGPNRPGAAPFELHRCDIVAEHARDRRGALSEARLAWRLSGLHPGVR